MADKKSEGGKTHDGVVVIKKYANRRLYNTATSAYVTLDDLARMVREGFENILDSYALALFPSLAVLILVLALNLIGDGLRDAIDPNLRTES